MKRLNFHLSMLVFLGATLMGLTWSAPALAGYNNLAGMVACNSSCYSLYYTAKKTCGQAPDFAGLAACNGLCRAIDAANCGFNFNSCFNACKAPGNGGYIGYYGGVVPCTIFCLTLYP